MLTIERLSKTYGSTRAVQEVSLTVEQGEIFALLGVNGAGKTTLIKMLCGLTRPSGGDAFLQGYSILTQQRQVKQRIGVAPQETAVAPQLTVRENLDFMAGIFGLSRAQSDPVRESLLDRLQLREVEHKKAGILSGGYQRRLSIAMALVTGPELLFLDEPTLGLDVLARRELWELVRTLGRERTVFLTTHYMEEAEALADRVGILQRGRMIAVGTVPELLHRSGTQRLEDAFVTLCREVSQ